MGRRVHEQIGDPGGGLAPFRYLQPRKGTFPMMMIRSIAVVAAFAFGASTSVWAAAEPAPGEAVTKSANVRLALTLDEMNCISSDLQVTNSIPCSKKGTNWGKPKKKRRQG